MCPPKKRQQSQSVSNPTFSFSVKQTGPEERKVSQSISSLGSSRGKYARGIAPT